jgi:hypothetical protein
MLMTRVLYASFTLILVALNVAALWQLARAEQAVSGLAAAALIVNAVAWPLALVITYRIGQITGANSRRSMRAGAAAGRASPADRHAG